MIGKLELSKFTALFALTVLAACGGGGGGGGSGGGTTPQAGLIALPKTGQFTCYDTSVPPVAVACTTAGIPPGQDGATQIGAAESGPRFTGGIGATADCVTDNLTGLMWARNANLPAATLTWQQALDFANSLSLCGFTDWRLPNAKELRSLVNYGATNNTVVLNIQGFYNVQEHYWSSTSYAGRPDYAWYVYMNVGSVNAGVKASGSFVWPVRAGQ